MNWAKTAVRASLAVVSVLPIIVIHGLLDPHAFARSMIMKAAAGAAMMALLFLWRFEPRSRPRATWFLVLGMAYAASVGMSALLGADPLYSLASSAERSGGVFSFWVACVLFLSIRSLLALGEDIRRLWRIQIAIGLAVSALSVAYLFAGSFLSGSVGASQIYGTLANPAFFAEYLLLLVFVSAALAASAGGKLERYASSVAVVVFGALVVWAQIRGAALGLAVGAALSAVVHRSRIADFIESMRRSAGARISAASLAAIACLILVAVGSIGGFSKFAGTFRGPDSSVMQRVVIWRVAGDALRERPLFGWGMENFFAAFYSHTPPELLRYTSEVFDRAHNEALEQVVTGGLSGAALAAAMVAALAFAVIDRRRRMGDEAGRLQVEIMGAGLLAYGVSLLFLFETPAAMVLTAMIAAAIDHLSSEASSEQAVSGIGVGAFAVGTVLTVMFLAFGVVLPTAASFEAKRGANAFSADLSAAYGYYARAIGLNTSLGKEIGKDLALRLIVTAPEGAPGPWLAAADLAERTLAAESERHPWDPAPSMVLGSMYEARERLESGYLRKAEESFEEAVRRAPKNADAYYRLALIRMKLWDAQGAFAAIDTAAGLIPEDPNLMKYRALLSGLIGDRKGSDETFEIYAEAGSGAGSPGRGEEIGRYRNDLLRVPLMHQVPKV